MEISGSERTVTLKTILFQLLWTSKHFESLKIITYMFIQAEIEKYSMLYIHNRMSDGDY